MELNFAPTEGTGLNKLIPHSSEEVKDLIAKLLIYNPVNRIIASLALKHAWLEI